MFLKLRRIYKDWIRKKTRFLNKVEGSNFIDIQDIGLQAGQEGEKPPVFISYATRDGLYDKFIERLSASLGGLKLDHDFETIPACDRRAASLFKPSFIKFKLLTLNRPVIWLDADSVILEAIDFPAGEWDVGLIKNDRNSKLPWAACLIYFNNTPNAMKLLDIWISLCSNQALERLDHHRLIMSINAASKDVAIKDLSESVDLKFVRDSGLGKENNRWG